MFQLNKYASWKSKPIKAMFFILVFLAIISAVSWIVMLLWNNILTDVTGVKPLNFWKAAGLLILAKIILGGFRRRRKPWKQTRGGHLKHKWMEMNDEERKAFKARWKEHCRTKNDNTDPD